MSNIAVKWVFMAFLVALSNSSNDEIPVIARESVDVGDERRTAAFRLLWSSFSIGYSSYYLVRQLVHFNHEQVPVAIEGEASEVVLAVALDVHAGVTCKPN